MKTTNIHSEHCCLIHGCKYGASDCPVEAGKQKQSSPCEECYDDRTIDEHKETSNPVKSISWKDVFNTWHGFGTYDSMSEAFDVARRCKYPYIIWNGWIYDTETEEPLNYSLVKGNIIRDESFD